MLPSLGDEPAGPIPALLTWKVAHKKMPWNIVLLLGGGFALAKGSEVYNTRLPYTPDNFTFAHTLCISTV